MAVGKIYLEAMMHHCGILFSKGYRFKGTIDKQKLQQSSTAILGAINKFQYKITVASNGEPLWQKTSINIPPLINMQCADIEQRFAEFSASIFNTSKEFDEFPMFFTLLESDTNGDEKNYIFAQTVNHTYCDARAAELIINWLIDYYNALVEGNLQGQQKIITKLNNLTTLASKNVYSFAKADCLIKMPWYKHVANLFKIITYKIKDTGNYSISYEQIKQNLAEYQQKLRNPIMRYYDVNSLINYYKKYYPNVNTNSLISALLVKTFYWLNVHKKQLANAEMISYRMLSDILTPKMRNQYLGNYIAYVPVTMNANQSLIDIAQNIDAWVKEFRDTKLDVSQYSFLEFAIAKKLVGKKDDPISFTHTSFNNRRLFKKVNTLIGATFIEMIASINSEPLDLMGAMMNNKIIACTSLSNSNRLYLTFYPLIGSDQPSIDVADALALVITQLQQELPDKEMISKQVISSVA
ncbi:hypothetical protein [Gilliamella sp. ESL0405]|uniref:hypothetical protein n=1 Tax=Gilliamella sp. ESL0405 TaxID=2704653 RepID=UPI001C6A5799|nr:hypothetical protein [Gilliamella sp. ESL0405]QYN46392.1 hypothetical protein GYM74_03880 [Gilliamella sp. ESL0405]